MKDYKGYKKTACYVVQVRNYTQMLTVFKNGYELLPKQLI